MNQLLSDKSTEQWLKCTTNNHTLYIGSYNSGQSQLELDTSDERPVQRVTKKPQILSLWIQCSHSGELGLLKQDNQSFS